MKCELVKYEIKRIQVWRLNANDNNQTKTQQQYVQAIAKNSTEMRSSTFVLLFVYDGLDWDHKTREDTALADDDDVFIMYVI